MNTIDLGTDHCRVIPPDEAANVHQHIQFFRHLFAYAQSIQWIPPQAHVLEVGAGEGYGANYYISHSLNTVATDLSLKTLRHAMSRYPGPRYCQTLGTALPFASSTFDGVISFQVIEHIEDATAYVQEVRRVLKPDSLFILTTPNRKLRLLPFQKPWNPYHVREYSARELKKFLKNFFEEVHLYGVMATPDIMKLVRVKQNFIRVYGSIVKQGLKRLIPGLQSPLSSLKLPQSPEHEVSAPVLNLQLRGLDDFFLSPHADQGMDLFAIACMQKCHYFTSLRGS